MTRLCFGLSLLIAFTATSARAQSAPPVYYPPPPPIYYAQPPTYYPPPPYVAPVDVAALEHRGHSKKVAGGVLMGLGTALSIVGMGLAIDGALHMECHGHEEHAVCTPSTFTSEAQLGTTALLVGQVMTLIGIPVYIVGGHEVAKARRLSGQLTLQPLLGRAGAGGAAQLSFRF